MKNYTEEDIIDCIVLPPNSKLNSQIIADLDFVFEMAPPLVIRDTLIELYTFYLLASHDTLPKDFHEMAEAAYLMIGFLKNASEKK